MTESLADWVARHLELLRRLHPDGATLDAVGEVIGAQAVGMEHIEALLDALEAEGLAAREVLVPDLSATLRTVLQAARELRARGEPIAPQQLALQTGLSVRQVRVALLYADVLKR